MNKYLKIILLFVLFSMFFLVRIFQDNLFYDPLVEYFKNDYLYADLNNVAVFRLIKSMFFRFTLNSLISLSIIWVIFQRKDYFKFSTIFLIIAFIVLIIPFAFLLKNHFDSGYLLPFYIRRFIIHPIFLLLLLPAFYFQKLSNK